MFTFSVMDQRSSDDVAEQLENILDLETSAEDREIPMDEDSDVHLGTLFDEEPAVYSATAHSPGTSHSVPQPTQHAAPPATQHAVPQSTQQAVTQSAQCVVPQFSCSTVPCSSAPSAGSSTSASKTFFLADLAIERFLSLYCNLNHS